MNKLDRDTVNEGISAISTYSVDRHKSPPEIIIPDQSKFNTVTIVEGIDIPWGMDFISENEFLVTEKKGVLYRVLNGKKTEVSGLPEIYKRGQGGLMDVALHPDFKNNKIIYFR